jgi:hypothetical protein
MNTIGYFSSFSSEVSHLFLEVSPHLLDLKVRVIEGFYLIDGTL